MMRKTLKRDLWSGAKFKVTGFEHFSGPLVNLSQEPALGRVPLLNICANGAESSKVFWSSPAEQETTNTWKAMTTNANTKGVPSFWQKWWNALITYFKRGRAGADAAGNQPPPGTNRHHSPERKAMA